MIWSVPGRAADAEVDPARVQADERPELLGDDQRRVVRQHHAAEPTRIVEVEAASSAASTAGAALAMPGML